MSQLLTHVPDAFDLYLEPFVGAGAMFCALWNDERLAGVRVILADADADLVMIWAAIRDNVHKLIVETQQLSERVRKSADAQAAYLYERTLWNEGDRTPARNLFLRRTSFNGLWRTNRQGQFNVPWRGKAPADLDVSNLEALAFALGATRATVRVADFREHDAKHLRGTKTLIYGDPPYYQVRNGKKVGFTAYTRHDWTESDFVELLTWLDEAREAGATTILSHADTLHARSRIAGLTGGGQHDVYGVWSKRNINSKGSARGPVSELIAVGQPITPPTGASSSALTRPRELGYTKRDEREQRQRTTSRKAKSEARRRVGRTR